LRSPLIVRVDPNLAYVAGKGIMKAISASSSRRQSSKHGGSGAYQCSNNVLHQVFLFGKL